MAFSCFLRFIFVLSLFFSLELFASTQDYKSCQLKYHVSSIKTDTTLALAINENYVLFYSEKTPSIPVIKRDPFLGLNLIKTDNTFKHVFKFYNNEPKQYAAILPDTVVEGTLIQEQIGLNQLGKFSRRAKQNSIISGTCCGLVGLSTGKGIIDKVYIRHFLETEKIMYADIGIRVGDTKGVEVLEINPFFADSPFLLGDIVLFMDNKRVRKAAKLSQDILFSKPESVHYFKVLREGKEITLKAVLKKRLSGGLIRDSFFGLFGLELDEFLKVKKDTPKYEIKKGDKLLYIMGKEVNTLSDIRHVLSKEKTTSTKRVSLLFQREGFDFFIHFDKP